MDKPCLGILASWTLCVDLWTAMIQTMILRYLTIMKGNSIHAKSLRTQFARKTANKQYRKSLDFCVSHSINIHCSYGSVRNRSTTMRPKRLETENSIAAQSFFWQKNQIGHADYTLSLRCHAFETQILAIVNAYTILP